MLNQVEAISSVSGYRKGPVNIDARVTMDGAIYIIELSPRNGGNHVPIIIPHLTGFNFVQLAYLPATGMAFTPLVPEGDNRPGALYVLHSPAAGTFEGVDLTDMIRPHILHREWFKREGQTVQPFRGSNASLGVALLSFTSVDERHKLMAQANRHLALRVSSIPFSEDEDADPVPPLKAVLWDQVGT
jgi:hypothetical protein